MGAGARAGGIMDTMGPFTLSAPKVHPPDWYLALVLVVPLLWVLFAYARFRTLAPRGWRMRRRELEGRLPSDLRGLAEAVSDATGTRVLLRREAEEVHLTCCPMRAGEHPLLHLAL